MLEWNLVQGTMSGQIDQFQPAQAESPASFGSLIVAETGTQHFIPPDGLAVLIVDVELGIDFPKSGGRRCRVGDAPLPVERPTVKVSRAPADAVQAASADVVDEAADVIGIAEHFGRFQCVRIDAIDDRAAVGPILGYRHPDELAVEVDAARMIDRAFSQREIGDELTLSIHLEQMTGANTGVPVETVLR